LSIIATCGLAIDAQPAGKGCDMEKLQIRAKTLERLTTPEKLDDSLQIIEPPQWLALSSITLIVSAAVAWSIFGQISTKAIGTGVLIRTGDLSGVVCRGSGIVESIQVKVGETVHANQIVATVSQPILLDKIRLTENALAEAESDRDEFIAVRSGDEKLQIATLERQRTNALTEISELGTRADQLKEQIAADEQLREKGLVTKDEVLDMQDKLVAVKDKIESLRAELKLYDAQQYNLSTEAQVEALPQRAKVLSIKSNLDSLQHEYELAEHVVSPFDGQVTEVRASVGDSIVEGQSLLTVQPKVESLELVAFIPTAKAKETSKGMMAQISPSTIKREEFGYMTGAVQYVSDYPLSRAALMRDFENDELTAELARSGPVNEVRVSVKTDPTTPSGFEWSSRQGPDVRMTSGTLCTVQIVTRRQRPIELLLPYLRKTSE
jgi:HlyD family secretion protein